MLKIIAGGEADMDVFEPNVSKCFTVGIVLS